MAKLPVQFRLNGSDRAAFVDAPDNLLTTLRRGLGDFAPKYGCGQGTCGSAPFYRRRTASLLPDARVACEGRAVETASGMADGPDLHPLQAAFMENFAAQCGLLHARHADGRPRAAGQEPQSHPRGRHRRHRGQHLPLHGLRADHRGHPGGGGRPQPRGAPEETRGAGISQGLVRRRAGRQPQRRRQRPAAAGHAGSRHRPTRFFDDHAFEGLLHLKVVRSPHHHARIRNIDIAAASARLA
jgi:hypothetical protein